MGQQEDGNRINWKIRGSKESKLGISMTKQFFFKTNLLFIFSRHSTLAAEQSVWSHWLRSHPAKKLASHREIWTGLSHSFWGGSGPQDQAEDPSSHLITRDWGPRWEAAGELEVLLAWVWISASLKSHLKIEIPLRVVSFLTSNTNYSCSF